MTHAMPRGVLLVALGTPDAPTTKAVRRFLRAFLSDRRVVDLPRALWWPILHGIILRFRPRRSAALYERVWTPEGSPLLLHSEAQREKLAARLGTDFAVELGMRYGRPSLDDALDRLLDRGCRRVTVLPLFPQYSCATTASVFDAVAAWARSRRDVPGIDFVRSFPDEEAWIDALAETVRATGFEASPASPLLLSYHGIPQRYADEGDPYPEECLRTSEALAARLGLEDGAWRQVYQSRFGKEPWLQPYLDETLEALPGEGVRSVAVATPSFVCDCLETIDEVGRESREAFLEAGGEAYVRVPCPNEHGRLIDALETIARGPLPRA